MTFAGTYLERLAARSSAVGSVLCLGVDPDPAALPPGFSQDVHGIERFALLLIEAAAPFAAAVKRLSERGHAPAAAILDGVITSDGIADLEPAVTQSYRTTILVIQCFSAFVSR